MQRYFIDLKKFVEQNFPDFDGSISGGVYPPPQYAILIANLASYLWTLGIIFIVGGSQILKALGIPENELTKWINENKMGAFIGIFIINNIANSLLATGAFEVYVGDELIFSRLETHRFPSSYDLVTALTERGFRYAQ